MTTDWESRFNYWAQPPSNTEQKRCDNAIRAIRRAVAGSSKLSTRQIKVFTQGSYRNRVNIRQDSDIDVGVMLYDHFLVEYPAGKGNADFGNKDIEYEFSQFKNELEEALVDHFGRSVVTRGNKAFDIKATASKVEADVVPLWEFRQYWDHGSYRAGVALLADRGSERIENYPERLVEHWPSTPLHYENGISKNNNTYRRFKGIVRILKKLRVEMEDAGDARAKPIPGYLLECMVWNAPNSCFDSYTWQARLKAVLIHLWNGTKDDESCKEWFEVDAIKYLFYFRQPWTRTAAHTFLDAAWDYIGGERS